MGGWLFDLEAIAKELVTQSVEVSHLYSHSWPSVEDNDEGLGTAPTAAEMRDAEREAKATANTKATLKITAIKNNRNHKQQTKSGGNEDNKANRHC